MVKVSYYDTYRQGFQHPNLAQRRTASNYLIAKVQTHKLVPCWPMKMQKYISSWVPNDIFDQIQEKLNVCHPNEALFIWRQYCLLSPNEPFYAVKVRFIANSTL